MSKEGRHAFHSSARASWRGASVRLAKKHPGLPIRTALGPVLDLCFCISVPNAVHCLSYITLYFDKHCVHLDVIDWAPCFHFTPKRLGLLTI